ncbi:YtxH domain-containing protein [Enterococcus hulanensis]|uniref:YtxH domain-containing protein n=1 Tax=Enterococcus hulanensis TaxID=2559929 RepID=A0ABU3F0D8_9ENTE|nr:YtxH domain-containing protein [Enterococcus hulanensis]MDT2599973.1 YtxH domain-containing protein [Enterococcus hulanensis]MDT2610047.1 YtxH domain-containing protein [Enterococcus hulanensis]MDT2617854.1 YtxH domain-containing protein [Enterococcus hulanensis]MDT2629824.1 YtxH domain-containing protein [Enterococcus hulanensis]MDT2656419.1 YtxH domain-containing protein [Enterococcus hulanensis]
MSFFKGILFGAGLGTLGGLLLAPRKGDETREKLITNTRELVLLTDELNDNLADFRESLVTLKGTFDTLVPAFKSGVEKDVEEFRFQAQPRIQQIQAQLDKINQALPQTEEKSVIKKGRFSLERPAEEK